MNETASIDFRYTSSAEIINRQYNISKPVLYAIAFAFCLMALMRYCDLPLTLYVSKNLPQEVFDCFYFICKLGDAHYWVVLAALIYTVPNYILPFLRRNFGMVKPNLISYRYHLISIYIISVLAGGGLIANILKLIIGRVRPARFLESGVHEFAPLSLNSGCDSFPSGHSTTIWTAMLALYAIYPPLRPIYIALAVLVSAGRILVLKHYLSDVFAAACLAILLCLFFKRLIEKRLGKFQYP